MNFKRFRNMKLFIFVVLLSMLAACSNTAESQENTIDAGSDAEGSLAMVDSVTVERIDNQNYAVINGNYPDACTRISSVEQDVEGDTFNLKLYTKSPDGVMCAMMLTPFTVNILLTTGGLYPGEFTVMINEGPSTTFTLE